MGLEIEITVSDPQFFEAIQDPEGFLPILGEAMTDILAAYKEVAWTYAPESEANKPGRSDREGKPMGYYERGRGWWYPVRGHRTLGLGREIPILRPHAKGPSTMGAMALLAAGFEGVAGYKLIASSQQMHDRWQTEVQQNADEVLGFLRNVATYSDLVQGQEQVPLHRQRGWQTVEDSWHAADVQNAVDIATAEALRKYYNI